VSAIVDKFRPLFYPRGVVVTGVSQHPGKFGTVAFHNLISCGYQGELFPINREGVESFGRTTYKSVGEIPKGRADLVFLCTPNTVNEELLRECAKIGVRAAFVASAGYGEAADGAEMEKRRRCRCVRRSWRPTRRRGRSRSSRRAGIWRRAS